MAFIISLTVSVCLLLQPSLGGPEGPPYRSAGLGGPERPPSRRAGQPETETKKEFQITVQRFKFSPDVIEVAEGDRVRLLVKSSDVSHGLEIKKLKIKTTVPKGGDIVAIEFVADKRGMFQITCSEYCGSGHKRMKGTLVVAAPGQQGRGQQSQR